MILEVPNRGRARILGLVDGGDWDVASQAMPETHGFCARASRL